MITLETKAGPREVEPLEAPGMYMLPTEPDGDDITLHICDEQGNTYGHINVTMPLKELRYNWRRRGDVWDPEYDDVQDSRIEARYGLPRSVTPEVAAAVAEVLAMAVVLCRALNDGCKKELDRQRAAKQVIEERKEAERRAQLNRREKLQEDVQWMMGQRIKGRRHGYRATFTGTIKRVDERGFSITTERDQYMRIEFDDLCHLSVKYDGDRRFTQMFDEPQRL